MNATTNGNVVADLTEDIENELADILVRSIDFRQKMRNGLPAEFDKYLHGRIAQSGILLRMEQFHDFIGVPRIFGSSEKELHRFLAHAPGVIPQGKIDPFTGKFFCCFGQPAQRL